MKKYLILLFSFISTLSLFAERANRGELEGVTADDIKSGRFEENRNKTFSDNVTEFFDDAASILVTKEPTKEFSSLGSNYLQVGAGANFLQGFESGDITGIDAKMELNFNVYKNSNFGVDVLIPLEYTYLEDSNTYPSEEMKEKLEFNFFTFPIYLRPYYSIEINSDFTVKPFLQFGVGGRYSYYETKGSDSYGSWKSNTEGVSFVWTVGGGVEVSLYQDFYIQCKYLYHDTSTSRDSILYTITPEHEISAEVGYRFTKELAVVLQYSHIFWKDEVGANIDLDQDKIGVCIRFMF